MEITRVGGTGEINRVTGESPVRITNENVSKDPTVPIEIQHHVEKPDLDRAVKKMNDVFEALSTHLKFTYHEGTKQYYVSIVNEITNEVVREIPPKKFLDMVAYMEKQMKGIFVDETK